MSNTIKTDKQTRITDAKGKEIRDGFEVEIIPDPKNGKIDPDYGIWQVEKIFENTGQYPTLPNGPTVRLWRAFCDRWILPIAHIQMKD